MDSFDLVNQFHQQDDKLNQDWQAAYLRYQNARSALANVLSDYANRDPRFHSAHSAIIQAKQALGELGRIQEQLVVLLNQVDGDIGR